MAEAAAQRAVEVFNDEDPPVTETEGTQPTVTTEAANEEKVEVKPTGSEGTATKEETEEEVVVQIGEESLTSAEPAPQWVKDLRKTQEELRRRNRELEEQLQATKKTQETAIIGKKPTIDDFDFDAEKFEAALIKWHEQKRQVEDEAARKAAEAEAEEKAWKERLAQFEEGKKSLKVKDYDEAEMVVQNTLSVVQQGIIVQGASNPALVNYAIGKSPEKAKQLAAITDPVKFAFAVAQLEKDLKVVNKAKSPPPPEEIPAGHSSVAVGSDKQLEKLREEAARTGDYTKVYAYKREKRKE